MKTFTLTVVPKTTAKLDSKKKKLKKLKKKSKLLSGNDKNPVESAKAVKLSDSSKQPVIETPPAPVQVAEPAKIKHVDLHPWPFETQKSGKIRRREWNALVRSIIEANQSDCDAECNAAHEELHKVYEENKTLKEKYGNLLGFVRKHFREFEATFL